MAPDYKIAGEQKKKTDTSTHPNPKQFTSFGSWCLLLRVPCRMAGQKKAPMALRQSRHAIFRR